MSDEKVLALCRQLRPWFDAMDYHEQQYWMLEARARLRKPVANRDGRSSEHHPPSGPQVS